MRGERTADRQALVNRYGISLRLASRVAALLAGRVDVSPALLETAASDTALEGVLLEGELVTRPDVLTEGWLRTRARAGGFRDGELLRVIENPDGWRTVALEDDVLAEQAQEAATGGGSLAGTELMRSAPGGISRLETQELFTPEEVAHLKLAALTSQKAEERIEALRKLVFAPLGGGQKAGIFVNVLIDPVADVRVRREAVRSLEQIGFRPELAEAARRLFEAQEDEVIYAVQRLGALLSEAEEAETGVALAVILEVFDNASSCSVLSELLRLIAQSASILSRSPQKTEQFLRSALRHLSRDFEALRVPVEQAALACHREAPQVVGGLLWKEIRRSQEPRVRSFLVGLCWAVTGKEEHAERLASVAVSEILNPELPEDERSRLRYGMVRLGEAGAGVVLERLAAESGRNCTELIRLLDVICTEGDVSDAFVNDAVRSLLGLLELGDRPARRMILEAALCADPRVAAPLRHKLATELLAHMTEFRLSDTVEQICNTLEKIGPAALRPLFDFVVRRYPNEEAEQAFLSLGRIARTHPSQAPEELVREVFQYCERLFADPETRQGGFTVALAFLCGYTPAGAELFDRTLRTMKERLWKARYTFEIFDALGIMGGSDNARPKHQRDLFRMFERLINMKAPEQLGIRRETADGTVYEFGSQIYFDIRVVPSVVRGLERICVSAQATKKLRTEIVKRLLTLWEGVSNLRVVWSPGAVEALVRAMCSAACCPKVGVEMRVLLGRSLLRFLDKVSVVRTMGEICSRAESHPSMQSLSIQAGEEMLAEWDRCDRQDDERRAALLGSLGLIAANTALNADDAVIRKLRANVLDVLFHGLRAGIQEVRGALERLRDCPDLPQEQRREIRERLSRASALTRIRRQ